MRTRPEHDGPSGRDSQDRRTKGRRGRLAWLDDHPVERMNAIIECLGGILHDGGGRNLQCSICRWIKERKKIDIPTHTLKIGIGRLRNTLVVRCKRAHHQNALCRAVTKATGVSLSPRPRLARDHGADAPCRGQMRLTPQYKGLSDLSKALVDHLVEAVSVNGEPNGGISRTGTELMAAFGIRSWRKLYAAIDAVIDAGIVFRGSRALSLGRTRARPTCGVSHASLTIERAVPRSGPMLRQNRTRHPPAYGKRVGETGGRTWKKWENVTLNPLITLAAIRSRT